LNIATNFLTLYLFYPNFEDVPIALDRQIYVGEEQRHWVNYSCNKIRGRSTCMISVQLYINVAPDGRMDERTDGHHTTRIKKYKRILMSF